MRKQTNLRLLNNTGVAVRRVIFFLAGLVSIVCLVLGLVSIEKRKQFQARAKWKADSLQVLSTLFITNQAIATELENLKTNIASEDHIWFDENLLLMTNGEYLIYKYRHGANNGFVDHLFLAQTSDKRWLYSTYHFCNSMVMLLSDAPPSSISEFEARYAAKGFDGKSDECLKHTWPVKK